MESVIDKLSEIETAASRIMESAVEETRRQDNAAEERTSTYDNDTDAQAARTLEAAKRTLQEQADQELEHLKTSTERSLRHMDAYYKEHKDALCDKIYHKWHECLECSGSKGVSGHAGAGTTDQKRRRRSRNQ